MKLDDNEVGSTGSRYYSTPFHYGKGMFYFSSVPNDHTNAYRRHITKITQKNGLFFNKEQTNLFIQRSSIKIMDMMRHKKFGCYAVYD